MDGLKTFRLTRLALLVAALVGSAGAQAQSDAGYSVLGSDSKNDTSTVPVAPVKGGNAKGQELKVEEASQLDTVEVTGSRILRDEFASSSPISTFGRSDVDLAGTVSVDEFLKEVPSFTGFQQTVATNNGSDGQKKVDLRGLGFNRLLVLINGRRQIGDVNGDGAVDLNTIPDAIIDRVEVLKDGASTVYGSDALSGVVNIILKDKFEGLELRANSGVGYEGQAANQGWSLVGGATTDRGNITMSLGYSKQTEMYQAERSFATAALYPLLGADGVFRPNASGSSNSRRIRVDIDDAVAGFESQRIVDASTGQARAFGPGDVYNFAPVNALITPNERFQIAALGNLDVTDNVHSYFEAMYTRRTSHQRLAPDASFAVTTFATPNNGVQNNDYVPASNPFNPYGVNPRNPDGISNEAVRINRRFVESGGRIFEQGSDTFRLVTGFDGEIMETGVLWDLAYIFAQNETINNTKNYHRFDRWAIAVDPAACGADPDCAAVGVLNPFDDYGSISPGQMRYLSTGSLKDASTGQLNLISLNLNGQFAANVFEGGAIGWAAGAEYRREKGDFSPDEFSAEGLTTGGANDPQSGAFSAKEVYGELLLPVLDNVDLDLSMRHSKYDNDIGNATTYKIGVDYQPTDTVRVRAGISTGFRAPNITELNQGQATGFPIVETICEFADRRLSAGQITQAAYDNCVALGEDTTDAGELGFAWQSAYTTLAPAQNLKPEESMSHHLGVIVNPEFLKGLSLGVDYWDIEVENVIGAPDINDLLTACMNSVGLSDTSCDKFTIDGGETFGTPYGGGVPGDAVSEFGNLGTIRTSGIDLNAFYEADLDFGALPFISKYHLLWAATYLMSFEREFALGGTKELAGTANGFAVYPEWRWNAEAGVGGDAWTAGWQLRFVGETEDALRPASVTDDAKAESVMYHDLVGTYSFGSVSLSGGINNITNVEPPRFHSAFNANTEPGTYDVVGRRLFAGLKVTF